MERGRGGFGAIIRQGKWEPGAKKNRDSDSFTPTRHDLNLKIVKEDGF